MDLMNSEGCKKKQKKVIKWRKPMIYNEEKVVDLVLQLVDIFDELNDADLTGEQAIMVKELLNESNNRFRNKINKLARNYEKLYEMM